MAEASDPTNCDTCGKPLADGALKIFVGFVADGHFTLSAGYCDWDCLRTRADKERSQPDGD